MPQFARRSFSERRKHEIARARKKSSRRSSLFSLASEHKAGRYTRERERTSAELCKTLFSVEDGRDRVSKFDRPEIPLVVDSRNFRVDKSAINAEYRAKRWFQLSRIIRVTASRKATFMKQRSSSKYVKIFTVGFS